MHALRTIAGLSFVLMWCGVVGCSSGGVDPSSTGPSVTDASPPAIPSDAGLGFEGSGGDGGVGGDSPSAPSNVLMTAQRATGTTLAWQAATPGASPIDHYRVYRNGAAYDTVAGTTYTDHAATGCQVLTLDAPSTIYDYAIAAVDARGHEGPQATQVTLYGYRGATGGSTWSKGEYSYGLTSLDWSDTSGSPVGGGTDIKAVYPAGAGAGFQPYSNEPQVPMYNLELGAFHYLSFDIKAAHAANDFFVAVFSRLPFGDVFTWVDVRLSKYATLTDGKWTTVKIPLADLHLSQSAFNASIGAPFGTLNGSPFATLHVTSLTAGAGVDNGGFLMGTGLSGAVYVVANDQTGSVGGFKVEGPGVHASTTSAATSMTYQRTNMYKISIGLNNGMPGGDVYFNNIAFTRQ